MIKLIEKIAENDEQALQELFKMYYPVVDCIKKIYYLRDFDSQDWDQEALIVCYDSAKKYNESRGGFGTYFKRRFRNHVRTLLRANMATRRKAHNEAISLDYLQDANSDLLLVKSQQDINISISEVGRDFYASLSHVELVATFVFLGFSTIEEAQVRWNVTPERLRRAKCRVYHKLLSALS